MPEDQALRQLTLADLNEEHTAVYNDLKRIVHALGGYVQSTPAPNPMPLLVSADGFMPVEFCILLYLWLRLHFHHQDSVGYRGLDFARKIRPLFPADSLAWFVKVLVRWALEHPLPHHGSSVLIANALYLGDIENMPAEIERILDLPIIASEEWGMIYMATITLNLHTIRALRLANQIASRLPRGYRRNQVLDLLKKEQAYQRWTDEQLADRLAPIFEYPGHQLTLNDRLQPVFQSTSGSAPAGDAAKWWAEQKANVQAAVKAEVSRLKHAAETGRRWARAEWQEWIAGQPVQRMLAQRLVWGAFGSDGKLQQAFRLQADGSLAGREGSAFEFTQDAVGIVSSAHLTAEEVAQWKAAIPKPLFEQFPAEADVLIVEGDELAVPSVSIHAARIMTALEDRGWTRARVEPDGYLREHVREFPRQQTKALVRYTGIPVRVRAPWEKQSLARCYFTVGEAETPAPLQEIDPQVRAAVIADLKALEAIGK